MSDPLKDTGHSTNFVKEMGIPLASARQGTLICLRPFRPGLEAGLAIGGPPFLYFLRVL